ncbi:MAG: hypothetical protein ACR2PZ_26745 [Pseudomonadales bacterium]
MQPERFTGPSVRAVMAEVRAAFGRDALILEQKTVGDTVEMLATLAPEPDGVLPQLSLDPSVAKFRAQIDTHSTQGSDLYVTRLSSLGFSEAVLSRLPAKIQNWQSLMPALLKQIPVAERLPASGLVSVTGPSGAGVTSSLIKYAVHLLRCGKDPRRIQFVQCGAQRLGSDEALQLAGQMLDISVQRQPVAEAAQELAMAHPETLVLADLSVAELAPAGQSQLNDPLTPEQELLVLPAHWHPTVLKQWLSARDEAPGNRHRTQCLVTNVDRVSQWGEWLSLLIERQWPLALVGTGPSLPDDLRQPRWDWLEQQLLEQIDRFRPATKVNAGEPTVDH